MEMLDFTAAEERIFFQACSTLDPEELRKTFRSCRIKAPKTVALPAFQRTGFFNFLALPPELRNQVFEYYSEPVIQVYKKRPGACDPHQDTERRDSFAFAQLNSELRKEYLPLYLKKSIRILLEDFASFLDDHDYIEHRQLVAEREYRLTSYQYPDRATGELYVLPVFHVCHKKLVMLPPLDFSIDALPNFVTSISKDLAHLLGQALKATEHEVWYHTVQDGSGVMGIIVAGPAQKFVEVAVDEDLRMDDLSTLDEDETLLEELGLESHGEWDVSVDHY